MSHPKLIILILLIIMPGRRLLAQGDSAIASVQQISAKYLSQTEQKIKKYSHRITSKTEKTLTRLARWEKKIQVMLQKGSPETAQRFFANKDLTFSGMLEKFHQGKIIAANTTAKYDAYRDKLATGFNYLGQQKGLIDSNIIAAAKHAHEKMKEAESDIAKNEMVEEFITQRKKALLLEATKIIGKNKYLSRINKETYYYAETLKNYKEIFSEPGKAEAMAKQVLDKIPAFQQFMQKNSIFSSLFASPTPAGAVPDLSGLQTRSSINALIQDRLSGGGPNAIEAMKQQLQAANAEMNKIKEQLLKSGANGSDDNMPDFKPNSQRSKMFRQRIEYSSNIQFAKSNNISPAIADVALSIGYKINDKSIAGVGISYKLGLGSIRKISFTHQGIGFRSFLDWKIRKNFFASGGGEFNYNNSFTKIEQLNNIGAWQFSALIGVKKNLPVKTKMVKKTSVQLLYDLLYRSHIPATQPILFRIGYSF